MAFRKYSCIALLSVSALLTIALSQQPQPPSPLLPGGIELGNPTDIANVQAARIAFWILNGDGFDSSAELLGRQRPFTYGYLTAVATQVVNGINYYLEIGMSDATGAYFSALVTLWGRPGPQNTWRVTYVVDAASPLADAYPLRQALAAVTATSSTTTTATKATTTSMALATALDSQASTPKDIEDDTPEPIVLDTPIVLNPSSPAAQDAAARAVALLTELVRSGSCPVLPGKPPFSLAGVMSASAQVVSGIQYTMSLRVLDLEGLLPLDLKVQLLSRPWLEGPDANVLTVLDPACSTSSSSNSGGDSSTAEGFGPDEVGGDSIAGTAELDDINSNGSSSSSSSSSSAGDVPQRSTARGPSRKLLRSSWDVANQLLD